MPFAQSIELPPPKAIEHQSATRCKQTPRSTIDVSGWQRSRKQVTTPSARETRCAFGITPAANPDLLQQSPPEASSAATLPS
jgi:hypothetical protein